MNLNTAMNKLVKKHGIVAQVTAQTKQALTIPTEYTGEDFKKVLPKEYKGKLEDGLIAKIGKMLEDTDMQEAYRENILSHVHVLNQGKFTLPQYVVACKFVSHKLLGKTDIDAYVATFPNKYATFKAEGKDNKEINHYANAYAKTKLVVLVTEQTMMPVWISNNFLFQEAINKEANLMRTAKSEFVQHEAAKTLIMQLRPPEKQEIELNVGVKKESMIENLKQAAIELATMQVRSIQQGKQTPFELAHSSLVIDIEEED